MWIAQTPGSMSHHQTYKLRSRDQQAGVRGLRIGLGGRLGVEREKPILVAGGDHDMLVKRTLPSKFEIKTEHNVLFETLRLCADAIRLFQAIDPRLPQVAPLDARMFQVSSINGLLEGLWMIFCFSSK